jgi:hypothetical protein
MHFSSLILSLVATSHGATIAELIRQNPALSQVAGEISKNPAWNDANARITVFAPTNDAISRGSNVLPSGDLGVFVLDRVLDYNGLHYVTLDKDISGTKSMIFGRCCF